MTTIDARLLALSQLGERSGRWRLADPTAGAAMAPSLRSCRQLAVVTACWRDLQAELLDGFKRHTAAAPVAWTTLNSRRSDAEELLAKAALYELNRTGHQPIELEEARMVQAPVRENLISLVAAARLLDSGTQLSAACQALLKELILGPDVKQPAARVGPRSWPPRYCRQWSALVRTFETGGAPARLPPSW